MKIILIMGILFFSFIGILSNRIPVHAHANSVLYDPPSNSISN